VFAFTHERSTSFELLFYISRIQCLAAANSFRPFLSNRDSFFLHLGSVGSIYYNCALSVYYVCVIKFSMSEDTFKRKIEPICHIIANVYAIAGASYLLAGQRFNSFGHVCWINAVPPNCINDPEVECIRGDERVYKYRDWFLGYSIYAVFAIIAINMLLIIWSVFMQTKKSDQWRFGSSVASDSGSGGRCVPCRWSIFSSRGPSPVAEKERGNGTSCAAIDGNDAENPHHRHLVPPLEECLQPVKSPKVSASLTTRPGTTHKSSELLARRSIAIYGEGDEEDEGCVGSRRKNARASRAGTANDPYAFDLKKVKAKLQEESRRSSMVGIQTNRKVAFSVDMTPLTAMSAYPKLGTLDPPLSDRAMVVGAEGRGLSLSEVIEPSTRTARQERGGRSQRREVVMQGSLYIGAFFITWIWAVVNQ